MKVRVADRLIGEGEPCFIIAEAGINHNGDIALARKLIDAAFEVGADAVKFQTGRVSETTTKSAAKAEYQRDLRVPNQSQYDMLKQFEFTEDQWLTLAEYARSAGIVLFSKPSSESAVDTLLKMGTPIMKIGSGDVTYLTLLRHTAKTGLPIILSTGMSTLGEIEEAMDAILSQKNENVILLHCTSNYPSRYADANLRAILTLKQAFQLPVGYSDHSLGITVPIVAVSLGACVIEKHLTLNTSLPGPDHKASLEPHEFGEMIKSIRVAEEALGSPVKKPVEAEEEMRMIVRKSIVAKVDIPEGTIIAPDMLACKRPGTGLPQQYLNMVVGRRARVSIAKDELLQWEMI